MTTNGIDVSVHNGVIDWNETKKHIDYAILRVGYGQNQTDQDDKMFKRNADECTRLNIPFGVYLYSYAKTPADAVGEAQHTLRLIKGYKMAYPVYYDLEDEKTTGKQSNDTIAEIATTFADILEQNNYYVGMYASLYWWRTKLTDDVFKRWTKWIANYANELNYEGTYEMWQYSATGRVEGVPTPVDLNYCYEDFPTLIKKLGVNGYEKSSTEDISITEPNVTPIVEPTKQRYKINDTVRFNYVFLTSDSETPLRPYRSVGIITKIVPGTRNPYLIGKDQGWVNDQVIEGKVSNLSNPGYIGDSFSNALVQIGIDSSLDRKSVV